MEASTSARATILGNRRLARMRMGQGACELVNLVTLPEVRVAIVPLTEREFEMGYSHAAALDVAENQAGWVMRDRAKQAHDMWAACREPSDLNVHVFESIDQMIDELDSMDINYLSERYSVMLAEFSPDINDMDEETLGELKKVFNALRLSELSGRERVAVVTCRSLLLPMPVPGKSPGSTSMPLSTETKNDEIPVPSA